MERDDHPSHPNYFRVFYDEAQVIRDALPRQQAQRLLGAMALYFLFGDEPSGLPKQAASFFEMHRSRLDRYKNSVTNGMRNKRRAN